MQGQGKKPRAITDVDQILETLDTLFEHWKTQQLSSNDIKLSVAEMERVIKLAQDLKRQLDERYDSDLLKLTDAELEEEIARLSAGTDAPEVPG